VESNPGGGPDRESSKSGKDHLGSFTKEAENRADVPDSLSSTWEKREGMNR